MSPRSRARSTFLRAVPAVLLLALVGACGGSDDSDDAEGTTSTTTSTTEAPAASEAVESISQSLLDDGVAADEDEARCVAQRFVDELGEEDAKALDDSSDDLTDLPEDQLELVRTAFNECVSGTIVGEMLVTELYAGMGTEGAPDEVVSCVGDRYDGAVGDTMIEFSNATDEALPTSALDALEECVPTSDLAAVLAAQFEESGASPEEAKCAADGIAERISIAQFAEIGLSGGQIPPEIQSILTEEVTACGGTPPAG